jgi:TP901 family phage tail tape measure protein
VSSLPPVFAEMKANIGDFKSKFGEARGDVAKLSKDGQGHFNKLAAVGKAAMFGIGAAALGMGAVSVKLAGDFQTKMTALSTGAGETQANLGMVSKGLLKMSGEVGTSSLALADGMYNVESAGFHGAAGLTVLKTAAQGAKVGSADMAVVADALTSALNAYHLPASKAADVTNTLVATVAAGKMKMGDLASSLGQVLPIASSAHVKLGEVGAAIASMTSKGTDAATASTRLSSLMSAMLAPTGAATKAFKDMGLGAGDVSNKLTHQGLNAALTLITDTIGKKFKPGSAEYLAALTSMVGGQDQLKAALNLTGENAATFTGNIKSIGAAVSSSGGKVKGFSEVQKDWNFQLDSAKATAESLGISLGTALIPKLQSGMKALQGMVDWTKQHGTATKVLAGIIAGVLTAAITAYIVQQTIAMALMVSSSAAAVAHGVAAVASAVATGIWAAAEWVLNLALLANPLTWIVLAIIAVIAVIVLIATKTTWFQTAWKYSWNAIKAAVGAVVHWFTGTIWPSLQKAYQQMMTGIHAVWNAMKSAWNGIKSAVSAAVGFVNGMFAALGRATLSVVRFVVQMYQGVRDKLGQLVSFVRSIPGRILSALGNLGSMLFNAGKNIIQGLINGIKNMAGNVKNAVSGVLSAARNLLPFSPAKEGPFSGRGYPLYAGQSIGDSLATGIRQSLGVVRAAAGGLASAAYPEFAGMGRYGGAGGSSAGGYASGGGGEPIVVQLNVDGKRLIDVLVPAAQQRKRRSGSTGLA